MSLHVSVLLIIITPCCKRINLFLGVFCAREDADPTQVIKWIEGFNMCRQWGLFIGALYLYPLKARLYSQLLHRLPGMADVVGAVRLWRHLARCNTVTKNKGESLSTSREWCKCFGFFLGEQAVETKPCFLCSPWVSGWSQRTDSKSKWGKHFLLPL